MGGANSKGLKRKELEELHKRTHFTIEQIQDLYRHFKSISSSVSDDGVIDKKEFQQALGLQDSLFVDRMFKLFDCNDDGGINFTEFICGLSVFCPSGTTEEKLRFSFDIYDFDHDGHISKRELHMMLEASLVENHMSLSEEQIGALVEATFKEADADGDGLIDCEEYRKMVQKHPSMIKNMTISDLGTTSVGATRSPSAAAQ